MRRVGKTSLIRLLQERLSSEQTFYFDLEDFSIMDVCNKGPETFVDYLKLLGADFSRRLYIAIDEIQYLKNPSNFLKLLHDHHPEIKLLVTGSSSLEIKSKFQDSLSGRKFVFELDPLSFEEFLLFRDEKALTIKRNIGSIMDIIETGVKESMSLAGSHLERYFSEYLTFGGFPGVALAQDTELKNAQLKDIYMSYIRKDIKDIANIDDIYGYNNLLQLLAANAGNLLNVNEVTATVGLSVNTVKKYLFLLENTFIVTLLRPYHSNKRKEISKMPKVYFNDVGMRNTVSGGLQLTRPDMGSLVENFVFSELKRRFIPNEELFFWRTLGGAEVDFVIKSSDGPIPVEVKATDMKKPVVSRSLRSFIDAFSPRQAVVVNRSLSRAVMINGTTVNFVPLFGL